MLAIEELHMHRILHRDIKPANIIFDFEGNLMLTDFGFSRSFGRTTEDHPWTLRREWTGKPRYLPPRYYEAKGRDGDVTKLLCGTLGYMAPETISEAWYSYPADVWSLAVVVFEMLHGKVRLRRGRRWSALLTGRTAALRDVASRRH